MRNYLYVMMAAGAVAAASAQSYATVILSDDFDDYAVNDQITSLVPDVGSWGISVVGNASQHTVQVNPLGTGNALRSQRNNPDSPTAGFPTAFTTSAPEANTTYTFKFDTFRSEFWSTFGDFRYYMGEGLGSPNNALFYATIGTNEIHYMNSSGAAINTGIVSGTGGWERWELEITFGDDNGAGQIFGTYDLYFSRLDSSNDQGILARTQLANDISVNTAGFEAGEGAQRLLYSVNNRLVGGTATVYIDNVLVESSIVPEPASTLLLAAGTLVLSQRRRRHMA